MLCKQKKEMKAECKVPLAGMMRGFFVMERFFLIFTVLLFVFISDAGAESGPTAADPPPTAVLLQKWTPLMERLVNDGHDAEKIKALFTRPDVVFQPGPMASKLQALIRKKFEPPPAVISPRLPLYESYLKPEVIAGAFSYEESNLKILETVSANYCVPKEIIVAILLIETKLGEATGVSAAFNTLASMALVTDLDMILPYLPKDLVSEDRKDFARQRCRQKADWAYDELKALLAYAEKKGIDPVSIPGSIYGAIGLCQFMPTNAILYGIDADGDGFADLFTSPDALYSIANYLKKNGWTCKMTRQHQHKVILSYNKSMTYANTVQAIADKLKAFKKREAP